MRIHKDFLGGNIIVKEMIENKIFLENEIAFTLETTYFGTDNNKVSVERLVELGRCFAKAIIDYDKVRSKI